MADKNTATIGFEKQIWDAACVLRGNMDASEYCASFIYASFWFPFAYMIARRRARVQCAKI